MSASILSIANTIPPHIFPQEKVPAMMQAILLLSEEERSKINKIYSNTAIHKRHSILPDFLHERSKWHFWGADYPKSIPGMTQRNEAYKEFAPKLACEAAQKALSEWGGNPKDITHVISVSCTGVVAPGIEFDLIQSLGLKPSVFRLGINFMGCFGAFKGLNVAKAFAKENPSNRVLLVCTELCTLHFQSDLDLETLTANAIFADGAAAAIVGANPTAKETALWTIANEHSLGIANSKGKMSWEASDRGFLMRLSAQVPVLIGRQIKPFVDVLLDNKIDYAFCDWAIHPGGKSILQAVEKTLQLDKTQTQASWDTLANYGNMSSATFLFVLKQLHDLQTDKKWTVGVGFGPGLSMEGILLEKGSL